MMRAIQPPVYAKQSWRDEKAATQKTSRSEKLYRVLEALSQSVGYTFGMGFLSKPDRYPKLSKSTRLVTDQTPYL